MVEKPIVNKLKYPAARQHVGQTAIFEKPKLVFTHVPGLVQEFWHRHLAHNLALKTAKVVADLRSDRPVASPLQYSSHLCKVFQN